MTRLTETTRGAFVAVAVLAFATAAASAQERYFPLDHRQQTGMAGRWSVLTSPQKFSAPQAIAIHLPSQGEVAFFQGTPSNSIPVPAPARANVGVGYVYRVRISGMPEFPGVELYPTIEILDRLHPPPGFEQEFPIPVEFTIEEIETALQDQMITKVIYLEQPDLANPKQQSNGILVEDLPHSTNLLKAADLRGRPMAIVRLGGRIPDRNAPTDEFYCHSPLVLIGQ